MSEVIVRFAPSPTGYIHIGNIRTALLNWCFAQKHGGKFILRYDDTDLVRSKQEYADAIAEDIAWLGVKPAYSVRESDRMEQYDKAAQELKERGLLYACYEKPEELERRRKLQRARGMPPVYDRAALKMTPEDIAAFEAEGRKPHWRFKLSSGQVKWNDGVRGEQVIDLSALSDPVLVREDGSYLYTFTSVIDDVDMHISHIIRGEDHVTNTAVQLNLFKAMGAPAPQFAHHNLLTNPEGAGLSKRMGHLSIRSLRERGFEPMAVASMAVLIGSAEAVSAYGTMEELNEHVDLMRLSRAPAKFDEHELEGLNKQLLHKMSFSEAKPRMETLGLSCDEAFWLVVRQNLNFFDDVKLWWAVAFSDVSVVREDMTYLKTAASLLPQEPWSETTWGEWTKAVSEATGFKGKALFMPLRLALTGLEHGPDMKQFLPFIGRQKTLARLGE